MNHKLIKLLTNDKEIRLYLVDSTDIMNGNIIAGIKTEIVKKLYQKLLINCSLMRGLLTEPDQRLNISIHFKQEGCSFYCYMDGSGNINCTLSPLLCNYEEDISQLVGKGATLSITRGSWTSGMFTGTVEIDNPSVDHFFSYFYTKSEQTQTIFKTWIEANRLRGCMIQPLPFADETKVTKIIRYVDEHGMILSTGNFEEIPRSVFPESKVIEQYNLQLECDCSKEMFYGLLMSISTDELKQSICEGKEEEMVCGICGKNYRFSIRELENIVRIKENQ